MSLLWPALLPRIARLRLRTLALLLAVVFAVVHAYLIWLCLGPQAVGANDLALYGWWVGEGLSGHGWMGLEVAWVYPVGALFPMVLAAVAGFGTPYTVTWCLAITLVNAVTCLAVIRLGAVGAGEGLPKSLADGLRRASWPLIWWLGFLGLLGPVAMARLDALVVPPIVVALLVAARRPKVASVLLMAGAWIKVAPAVVLAPVFAVTKRRWAEVVLPALGFCAGVVLVVFVISGSVRHLLSFLVAESDRGLQVESVLATPVVLAHALAGEQIAFYNQAINTNETWGGGAEMAMLVGDIGLPLLCLVLAVLAWLARHRPIDGLILASQGLLAALIVANKVGSPQFCAWLAPVVLVALVWRRDRQFWRPMALLVAACALLTGVIFPMGYIAFLSAWPPLLVVYLLRNIGWTLVLVATVIRLVRLVLAIRAEMRRSHPGPRTDFAPEHAANQIGPSTTSDEPAD
ncbi:MAG: glycosyltransferase 87 family protein [Micrococcales bacterium]|nr:glycosyltransferase 87 family protein [Micrococcales bacterium]